MPGAFCEVLCQTFTITLFAEGGESTISAINCIVFY